MEGSSYIRGTFRPEKGLNECGDTRVVHLSKDRSIHDFTQLSSLLTLPQR